MPTSNAAPIEFDVEKERSLIRDRILHALEIFPFLSLSALHQQVGTATPRSLWQPVLHKMVEGGEVSITEVTAKTPTERNQSYTIYHLSNRIYQPFNDNIHIITPANN